EDAVGIVAVIQGWTALEQGNAPGRSAVVVERVEHGIDRIAGGPNLVAVRAVGDAGAAGAVADQVVPHAGERTRDIGIHDVRGVLGNDGTVEPDGPALGGEDPAADALAVPQPGVATAVAPEGIVVGNGTRGEGDRA